MAPATDDDRNPALHLWVVLSRAYHAVQAHAADDVARHDLSLGEFGVLEALHHRGEMQLCDIQEKILVSSGGITYLVDRLEERGLVQRRPHPEDRRARLVDLTDTGQELIRAIFPEHAERMERATAGLTDAEKREAARLLKELGRHAATLETAVAQAAGG